MINLWTQEWGWSDWRRLNSHLNDKEAKALYLTEQAMYQDMHTQHVINNINTPAGGGDSAAGSGLPPGHVRMTMQMDLQQTNVGNDTVWARGTDYDFMTIGAVVHYSFSSEPAASARAYWNDNPDERYFTVDWGDGSVEKVPLEWWITGRYYSGGSTNASWGDPNDPSLTTYWAEVMPAVPEGEVSLGQTFNGVGISSVYNGPLFANNGFQKWAGYAWQHRFPSQGAYTITITGPKEYLDLIQPIHNSIYFGGSYPHNGPEAEGSGSFGSALDLPVVGGLSYWTGHYLAPIGGITDLEFYSGRIGTMGRFYPNLSNWYAQNPASMTYNSNGWIDLADPKFTPSQNLIDLINNGFNGTTIHDLGAMAMPFGSAIGLADIGIDVSNWDLSGVGNNGGFWLFHNAGELPPGIGNWDISNVKTLSNWFVWNNMGTTFFGGASGYNSYLDTTPPGGFRGYDQDLSGWDTSNVTTISRLTMNSPVFNNTSIASWDLSSLTFATDAFKNNTAMTDANLEIILKAWADNANTNDNVNATNIATGRTYSAGSNMDLAIQTLTAKGWTISGITIS